MKMKNRLNDIMHDWSGIPLCATDVLVFVNIRQIRDAEDFIYEDPKNKKLYKAKTKSPTIGIGWKVMWETTVTEINGTLHCELPRTENDPIVMIPIDLAWDLHKQGNGGYHGNFFCIKGLTDSEEVFFKHFFRDNMSGLN